MIPRRLFQFYTRNLQPYRLPSRAQKSWRFFYKPATPFQQRQFPKDGFERIASNQLVEEERLPYYNRKHYYPMTIGEVVGDRYQVVAKLGYGTSSTVWLAHDLESGSYWALKVHINTMQLNQELQVYKHLTEVEIEEDHPGKEHVRHFEETFHLKGPYGEHLVFVMKPLGMSLRTFQKMQKGQSLAPILVKQALGQTLLGLSFLHEADVIHTNLHSDNLLIALTDDAILAKIENDEMETPSARKRVNDTIIHVSRYMLSGAGPLTICDLGQARIGPIHHGNAMPLPYRAPEVILDMPWDKAVDMWSVGLLAWDLLENSDLFKVYHETQELNDAHHLAAITSLLGPPPKELLERSKEARKYWDENGKWKGPVPLPPARSVESLITKETGRDKEMLVSFLECTLDWLPEERLKSHQAYFHPWVSGESAIEIGTQPPSQQPA